VRPAQPASSAAQPASSPALAASSPALPAADPDLPYGRPAAAGARSQRSRPGPARGYAPLPGDPGPRYPQREFSAWNESAASASLSTDELPLSTGELPFSAPTWADTDAFDRPDPEPAAHGVALAERPGDPRELAGFSDDDVAAWTALLADSQGAPAASSPFAAGAGTEESTAGPSGPDAGSPPVSSAGRTARSAGRTRAATARARKTARRKVRTRRRVVVTGVCVPAIAVVAAMALQHPGGSAPGHAPGSHIAAAVSPVSPPTPSLGPWQHIATRAGDPSAVSISQLFPARFTVGSAGVTRTAVAGSADCSGAVFGAKLQAAVRKSGCSQVMRASYLAPAQKLMGTIGVLNLANFASAGKAGKVTGSSQFVSQLNAASGPTHSLTKGTGLEEAEVKGHYLILTWVEFTTHRAPRTAAARALLKTFSADLISQTANISLTTRMVTGRP
jgi:hypothetical protein